MIILITGMYPVYDRNGFETGEIEFGTSHGIDDETGDMVITTHDHPSYLGAKYDPVIQEWVIE